MTDGSVGDRIKRLELGQFLKAMRDRLKPADVGRPSGLRARRAAGLLREEVAEDAGISATWYTWLEQARPIRPSPRALDGLAQALRLNAVERAHLFRLAEVAPDTSSSPGAGLPAGLEATLEGVAPHPAYALDPLWTVLAWNAPADRLFGGFGPPAAAERNLLRRLFLDSAWRTLFSDWEVVARSAVAQFRAATAAHCASEPFCALVDGLQSESRSFAELWRLREVLDPPLWSKTLNHPQAGRLRFNYAALGADSSVALILYTPADADSAERFAALVERPTRIAGRTASPPEL